MNPKKFFEWLLVKQIDPLARPLLKFSGGPVLTVRDAHQGTLMLGSPGSGKSTGSRTLMASMMRAGYGGLALVVKDDFVADVLAVAESSGRARDVVVLRVDGAARFNPFHELCTDAEVLAMIAEACECTVEQRGEKSRDSDWDTQRDTLLEYLGVACRHLHGALRFRELAELYDAVPRTPDGMLSPAFKATPLGRLASGDRAQLPPSVQTALRFLLEKFPAYPDRTQGSVRAMVEPVFRCFGQPELTAIFEGEPTITMDEVLNHRKILLAALPATGPVGRCANAILQHCFIRAAMSRRRLTDAFLFCDEFQETAGSSLTKALSLFRQYRVSPVLISQGVPSVEYRIGRAACENILGLMHTVILFQQKDPRSREWAEKYAGEEEYTKRSTTGCDGKTSTTTTREQRPRLRRDRLLGLRVGTSFCLQNKDLWRSRWPAETPRGPCPIRVKS